MKAFFNALSVRLVSGFAATHYRGLEVLQNPASVRTAPTPSPSLCNATCPALLPTDRFRKGACRRAD